ncbi:MAG: hypothetical protein HY678_10905 [Chloroflexi bacterium]|nr:hypothetical protein [Chloroflexota bacterium]
MKEVSQDLAFKVFAALEGGLTPGQIGAAGFTSKSTARRLQIVVAGIKAKHLPSATALRAAWSHEYVMEIERYYSMYRATMRRSRGLESREGRKALRDHISGMIEFAGRLRREIQDSSLRDLIDAGSSSLPSPWRSSEAGQRPLLTMASEPGYACLNAHLAGTLEVHVQAVADALKNAVEQGKQEVSHAVSRLTSEIRQLDGRQIRDDQEAAMAVALLHEALNPRIKGKSLITPRIVRDPARTDPNLRTLELGGWRVVDLPEDQAIVLKAAFESAAASTRGERTVAYLTEARRKLRVSIEVFHRLLKPESDLRLRLLGRTCDICSASRDVTMPRDGQAAPTT